MRCVRFCADNNDAMRTNNDLLVKCYSAVLYACACLCVYVLCTFKCVGFAFAFTLAIVHSLQPVEVYKQTQNTSNDHAVATYFTKNFSPKHTELNIIYQKT